MQRGKHHIFRLNGLVSVDELDLGLNGKKKLINVNIVLTGIQYFMYHVSNEAGADRMFQHWQSDFNVPRRDGGPFRIRGLARTSRVCPDDAFHRAFQRRVRIQTLIASDESPNKRRLCFSSPYSPSTRCCTQYNLPRLLGKWTVISRRTRMCRQH